MENVELKDRFIDEKTGIEYIRNGDYYLPNLVLAKQRKIQLNKYGRLRLDYLKNHKKAEYAILFMDNKLTDHLEEVQETATKRIEEIIKALKEQSDLTEEMKNTNQLYWVGMMNNFKNQAEEIKSFQRDLYGIANNINQIARVANSKCSVSHDDYEYFSH